MKRLSILIIISTLLFSCSEKTKSLRESESLKIEAFVKDKNFVRHDSGVYYKIVNASEASVALPKISDTDTIKIWYTASILSLYVYSTNVEAEAIKSGITVDENSLVIKEIVMSKAEIIEGLKNALLNLSKGDSAQIVIPFSLGYGNLSNGAVPAYSTLYYTIGIH